MGHDSPEIFGVEECRAELPLAEASPDFGDKFDERNTIPEIPALSRRSLYTFFDHPNVRHFNVYDLLLKFRTHAHFEGISLSDLKLFFKDKANLDFVVGKIFYSDSNYPINLAFEDEKLSEFISALSSKLRGLLKKDSFETINGALSSLSAEFSPLEMYLLNERVNHIISGFLQKSSEFVLEEIELIENVHKDTDDSTINHEFVSSTIAHLCSDFGTEASMQQLFALIVDRAFAEGIDARTLINFLQNENIEKILLNRVLFYANEGYFENGKMPVNDEIKAEINAHINYFSDNYKPTYQKYTFIATIKKLAQKYKDFDVLSYLKQYPFLRGLLHNRIPNVVDSLYIDICKQRLDKMDEDEFSKLRAIAKTQFSKIFYFSHYDDHDFFEFNVQELHNLFNRTLPQIYINGRILNYAEFRRIISEMMIDCIKKHPGISTIKMELSDEIISISLGEDIDETVRLLIEDNARTVNGDSELFDPLSDPSRTPLALEELAEKFITEGEVDPLSYSEYLLRHHSCNEVDLLRETEAVKEKVLAMLQLEEMNDLEPEAIQLFAKISNRIKVNKHLRSNDGDKILTIIKEKLRELFNKADDYVMFLEEKSGGTGFYRSERVKECNDLAELTLLAIEGKDVIERFEARRKISLALRMDRITKSGAFVFLDRNVNSIKNILRAYLRYEPSVIVRIPFDDHPPKSSDQKLPRLITPSEESKFTEQDKEFLSEIDLIPSIFSGVKCYILPILNGGEPEIIRKKSLQSIVTKQLRNKGSDDYAAMTLVVEEIAELEELTKLIQRDFLAYGKVLSIENKMGDLFKIRTKNVSINSSSSKEYRSIHYVVEMVITDPESRRELITTIEVRVILLDDLLKEKSLFHPASHKKYEQIRLRDVINRLVPRELYSDSYEVSAPDPRDIHGDRQIALKKKP